MGRWLWLIVLFLAPLNWLKAEPQLSFCQLPPLIKKLFVGPQMRSDDTKTLSWCMKFVVLSSPLQMSAFQLSVPRKAGDYWEAEMKLSFSIFSVVSSVHQCDYLRPTGDCSSTFSYFKTLQDLRLFLFSFATYNRGISLGFTNYSKQCAWVKRGEGVSYYFPTGHCFCSAAWFSHLPGVTQ